jgi:signal transduction histidine kinase
VPITLHGSVPDEEGPVALAAYRIVQEALANAARHAPGAAVRVVVTRDADAVALRVENDPPATPTEPGDGHGIAGMRERATLLGGTFDAGPTVFGGFAVAATLPAVVREVIPEGQDA